MCSYVENIHVRETYSVHGSLPTGILRIVISANAIRLECDERVIYGCDGYICKMRKIHWQRFPRVYVSLFEV